MKQALRNTKGLKRIGALISIIALVLTLGTGCGTTNVSQKSDNTQTKAVKYPTRPINIIVPFGAGGGADQLGRLLSKELGQSLGVSLPVVNMAGASGTVGLTKLVTEPADGYNLYVYVTDTHATLSGANPAYKLEEITPVARLLKAPSCLFVATDSPFKTWADLEKNIKANPGQVKVAGNGEGSVDDVALTYLEKNHGLKVNKIPYANPGERYTSIIGGHADVLYEQPGDVAQYIDQKQMRPVLVFDEKRLAEFPDVPCTGELGMKIFLPFDRTIMVKAGTSPEVITILSDAMKKIYDTSPDFQKFLKANYTTQDSYLGPEDAKKALQDSVETMKKALGK
ncbi:tripartite tricarboxylate transporter substrate binding protein [Desulfosporosinus fructosivorans]|uniref:Tripartite tricarboxylate transporter substrate binding protein n=1 Tax=Desulfosporosinus fructosivorans TaxID=2018669 RepID=A0A4Z0RC25_9FIRM|nr:tripartite tricarboxylate transporter substrate binding protein [Desulfosporosinus fructosivorans]TGE39176.1 tripartite tricarboxylate transporter substrate binding protein [Desulfosporosinus fructosivorans]